MPGINFGDDASIDVPLSAFSAPGGVRVAMGGVIYSDWTAAGNTAGVTTTLMTYTAPAGILATDGHSLWFEAVGLVKNTAGTKTVSVQFAGATFISYVLPASAQRVFVSRGRFVKVTTTCDYYAQIDVDGLSPVIAVATSSFDFASANTLNIRGIGTAAQDVVLERLTVGFDGV